MKICKLIIVIINQPTLRQQCTALCNLNIYKHKNKLAYTNTRNTYPVGVLLLRIVLHKPMESNTYIYLRIVIVLHIYTITIHKTIIFYTKSIEVLFQRHRDIIVNAHGQCMLGLRS